LPIVLFWFLYLVFENFKQFRTVYPQFNEQANGVYMQQDAEECLSMILQSCRTIPGHVNDNIISDLLEGEYQVTSKCIENDEEPPETVPEPFVKLPCHITSETNFLHSALESSMKEHISKFSSTLQRETMYEKSRKISKLPYYSIVQFVRFFWRQDTNMRAKICKPVEFPMQLDLFPFCTPELQKQLSVARDEIRLAEEKLLETRNTPKEEPTLDAMEIVDEHKKELPITFENDTGLYQLTAVISHLGRDADGGHYVAWVREKGDDWLLFDDNKVSPRTTEDIKRLTGHGGADWHIAYLCLYSTVSKDDALPTSI